MYQAPTETLTIGGVLDDGVRIYRETFSRVWLYALFAGIASLPMTYAANRLETVAPTPGAIVSFFAILIVLSFATLVFYSMLIARMSSIVAGQPMSFGVAAMRGLRRAPAYLAAAILFALMVGLSLFITAMIFALVGTAISAALGITGTSPVASVILVVIVMIIAFLPAAYISVTFFFYNYAAVIDNKGPGSAIAYSARIIRGNWWRTAAILTIAMFIITVAYLIVLVITGAVEISEATGTQTPVWLGALIDYIVAPAFQAIVVPLFYALPLAIYNDLKLRREGTDLAARIAAVGS